MWSMYLWRQEVCVCVCEFRYFSPSTWALVYNSDLDMMGRQAHSHNQLTHVVDWQLECPDVLHVGVGVGGGGGSQACTMADSTVTTLLRSLPLPDPISHSHSGLPILHRVAVEEPAVHTTFKVFPML